MPYRPPIHNPHKATRQQQGDKRKQQADKQRPTAVKRGYGGQWQKARVGYLTHHPLCFLCEQQNIKVLATVVDHINPHKGDMTLFWDKNNWQPLCKPCHDRKTVKQDERWGASLQLLKDLKPSKIPLTIVCGPPGSGKTTYVSKYASPYDLIIDVDSIKAKLSGLAWYQADIEWLKPALAYRNKLLASLGDYNSSYQAAWFITTSPKREERDYLAQTLQPVSVILLNPGYLTCIERVKADTRRSSQYPYWDMIIRRWFEQYTRRKDDCIVVF